MISSMTGFARSEIGTDVAAVTTVIRAYNHRFLDLVVSIPPEFLALEERIKQLLSRAVGRGRIDVRVQVRLPSAAEKTYRINHGRAEALHGVLSELKDFLGVPAPVSLETVLGFGDVIEATSPEPDLEACWREIEPCLMEAVDQLTAMRRREGDAIARDLEVRLATLERHLGAIEAAAGGLPARYEQRLRERLDALLQGERLPDPVRIAQEVALLADKSDIAEELLRAASHIQQMRGAAASEEPAGRKLNFLVQECLREYNTIGAKAETAEISHLVVELKSELEKIREQIQNIE
jgi:uncharacterized protein (TIGR00255 family)